MSFTRLKISLLHKPRLTGTGAGAGVAAASVDPQPPMVKRVPFVGQGELASSLAATKRWWCREGAPPRRCLGSVPDRIFESSPNLARLVNISIFNPFLPVLIQKTPDRTSIWLLFAHIDENVLGAGQSGFTYLTIWPAFP